MLPLPPMVTVFGLGTAAPTRMARRGPPAGFMITEYPRHIRPGMFRDHETAARATGRDHTPAGAGCPAHPGCLVPGCITVTPDRHPGRPWTTTPGRPWTTTPEPPAQYGRERCSPAGGWSRADVTVLQPSAAYT